MSGARRWVAVALAGAIAVLGACGDDDDDETAEGGGVTTTTSAPAVPKAWCDDLVRVQAIEPDVPEDAPPEVAEPAEQRFFDEEFMPLVQKIEREAPAAAKADITAIRSFFQEKGKDFFEDEGFLPLETRVNETGARVCGASEAEVTGTEYQFAGVPPQLKAGYTLLRLTNQGKELHDIGLLRKKPTTTESFDELLALEQEEAEGKVDQVGFVFAFPGTADTTILDVPAGDYVMVCFVPVGFTPEAFMAAEESGQEPEGPPHFTRGMKQEFKVV